MPRSSTASQRSASGAYRSRRGGTAFACRAGKRIAPRGPAPARQGITVTHRRKGKERQRVIHIYQSQPPSAPVRRQTQQGLSADNIFNGRRAKVRNRARIRSADSNADQNPKCFIAGAARQVRMPSERPRTAVVPFGSSSPAPSSPTNPSTHPGFQQTSCTKVPVS